MNNRTWLSYVCKQTALVGTLSYSRTGREESLQYQILESITRWRGLWHHHTGLVNNFSSFSPLCLGLCHLDNKSVVVLSFPGIWIIWIVKSKVANSSQMFLAMAAKQGYFVPSWFIISTADLLSQAIQTVRLCHNFPQSLQAYKTFHSSRWAMWKCGGIG